MHGPTLMLQLPAGGCRFCPGARFPAVTVMTGFGAAQRTYDADAVRKPIRGFRDGTTPTGAASSMSADTSASACHRSRGWRRRPPAAAPAS